jgi:hypothetical protein
MPFIPLHYGRGHGMQRRRPGDSGRMSDVPYGPGWWEGSDGDWHGPDEDFDAEVPTRNHPIRRIAIVLLAVAVVGATTFGVWLGGSAQTTGPPSGGPTIAEITSQVSRIVTGTEARQSGVAHVSGVVCHPPSSWSPGRTFECSVYGPGQSELGTYQATVESTTSSGEWRWNGVWNPIRTSSSISWPGWPAASATA